MYDNYGVSEFNSVANPTDISREQLKLLGYTTLESGLSQKELQDLRKASYSLKDFYESKFGHINLSSIGESNNYRAPLLMDSIFLSIAMNPNLLNLVRSLISGRIFLNQQNLIINPPQSKNYNQVKFHRDLPYQHYVSSKPLAINALLAVDDFTVENGATIVIPGSHKQEQFQSDEVIDLVKHQIEVKAGSFLVLDCMTFHAAGRNNSSQNRIGLNHVYSSVMLRPQIDWCRALSKEEQDNMTENEKSLLALDYPISSSVDAFLQFRDNRS
jgi:hypothetical protein